MSDSASSSQSVFSQVGTHRSELPLLPSSQNQLAPKSASQVNYDVQGDEFPTSSQQMWAEIGDDLVSYMQQVEIPEGALLYLRSPRPLIHTILSSLYGRGSSRTGRAYSRYFQLRTGRGE